jgi:hypothetical protein
MVSNELFSLALGLVLPWLVGDVTFQVLEKRLILHIDFPKGSRIACPHLWWALWWVCHQGAILLKAWLENAKASGLPPIIKVAYTIMNHWDDVLRWFESQINNGILEGFNIASSNPPK